MIEEFRIKAGKIFKSIREEHKTSQTKVGALLGKDQSQISRIERGLEDIRFSEVNKFCQHFGVSIVEFIAEVEYSA